MTKSAQTTASSDAGSAATPAKIDLVLIGRNEGERLIRALDAVSDHRGQIIYVDSGSTDNSVAEAEARGAKVVNLDMSIPFTAARARNAGFEALDAPQFVQFIDGDCAIVDGWLDQAAAYMHANPKLGIVTGWRAEIFPDASIYNYLAEFEWHQPEGDIEACGGDMFVRAEAFAEVGGFNPAIIASEDFDFCLRVGQAGWGLERLPENMTSHDLDMHSFKQWWQRAVRAGHGYAEVGLMHPPFYRSELLRMVFWAVGVPILALIALPWTFLLACALYFASFYRSRQRYIAADVDQPKATKLAALLVVSKFPNLIGAVRYGWRVLRGNKMELIEYK